MPEEDINHIVTHMELPVEPDPRSAIAGIGCPEEAASGRVAADGSDRAFPLEDGQVIHLPGVGMQAWEYLDDLVACGDEPFIDPTLRERLLRFEYCRAIVRQGRRLARPTVGDCRPECAASAVQCPPRIASTGFALEPEAAGNGTLTGSGPDWTAAEAPISPDGQGHRRWRVCLERTRDRRSREILLVADDRVLIGRQRPGERHYSPDLPLDQPGWRPLEAQLLRSTPVRDTWELRPLDRDAKIRAVSCAPGMSCPIPGIGTLSVHPMPGGSVAVLDDPGAGRTAVVGAWRGLGFWQGAIPADGQGRAGDLFHLPLEGEPGSGGFALRPDGALMRWQPLDGPTLLCMLGLSYCREADWCWSWDRTRREPLPMETACAVAACALHENDGSIASRGLGHGMAGQQGEYPSPVLRWVLRVGRY